MIPLSGDIPDSKGAICGKIDSNSVVRGTSTLKRGFAPVSYTHLTLPTICSV